jgi:hypothetical protein
LPGLILVLSVGSYAALKMGHAVDAMRVLTGCPIDFIKISVKLHGVPTLVHDADELWQKLCCYNHQEYLISASCQVCYHTKTFAAQLSCFATISTCFESMAFLPVMCAEI